MASEVPGYFIGLWVYLAVWQLDNREIEKLGFHADGHGDDSALSKLDANPGAGLCWEFHGRPR